MRIDISKQKLSLLYIKAKEGFNECIKHKDNAFLAEEVSIPLEKIELKESSVKIIFHQEIVEEYLLEIALVLGDGSAKPIGKYVYTEDDQGNVVEESLVFY